MLGMNFTRLDVPWPAVDWLRVWDIGCDWSRIHLAPGRFDWSLLDQVVARAESVGAQIIYTAHGTPAWLAENPNNPHNAPWMPPGANSVPTDLDEWNKFIWALVERYQGRIDAIELGNELQIADFLYPYNDHTRTRWAEMTTVAHHTIKSIDPDMLVLGASIIPRSSAGGMHRASKWLECLRQQHWPVDAMATHIYPYVGDNYPKFADYYDAAHHAVVQHGGPKHLWVTEASFDLGGPVMEDAKAQNILRKVREKHHGFVLWYAFDRPDLGGMSAQFKPGTLAWSELEKYRN